MLHRFFYLLKRIYIVAEELPVLRVVLQPIRPKLSAVLWKLAYGSLSTGVRSAPIDPILIAGRLLRLILFSTARLLRLILFSPFFLVSKLFPNIARFFFVFLPKAIYIKAETLPGVKRILVPLRPRISRLLLLFRYMARLFIREPRRGIEVFFEFGRKLFHGENEITEIEGKILILTPLDFDPGVKNISDIAGIVDYHNNQKRTVSDYLKSIYDYRSALVILSAAVIAEIFNHYAKSLEIDAESLAPLELLKASCGDLDLEEGAIVYLLSALKNNPGLAEAHYMLGKIHRERGESEKAIEEFMRAAELPPSIKLDQYDLPHVARAHFECGEVYEVLGRFDEAEESFRIAVEAAPDYYEAHRKLGHKLRARGEYGRAAWHFNKAMYYRPIFQTLPHLPEVLTPAGAPS